MSVDVKSLLDRAGVRKSPGLGWRGIDGESDNNTDTSPGRL